MYIKKVKEFHELFKHPVLESPTVIDEKRSSLRHSLLYEEVKELKDAIEVKDIVAIADALGDIQYVLAGAILEFGLKDKFDDIFTEIHRSNMSKLCKTEDEAKSTMEKYLQDGVESYYEKEGDYYHVKRKSDSKTLKSINYSPANLKQFFNL